MRQQMHGTIHQALERARLLLLAVACLLCAVPTARAIRCPTPGPVLNSEPPRLNEEMPSPEPDACYAVWVVDSQGRIGLFVGNNPVNRVDPFGLWPFDMATYMSSGGIVHYDTPPSERSPDPALGLTKSEIQGVATLDGVPGPDIAEQGHHLNGANRDEQTLDEP